MFFKAGGKSMYLKLIALLCVFTQLISCGEGLKNKSQDIPSLTLVTSLPKSGVGYVPVNTSSIQIFIQESLNPQSVNNETVQLILDRQAAKATVDSSTHNIGTPVELVDPNSPIKGIVWFDSQKKIIHFEPDRPLQHGRPYIIRVKNVVLDDNRSVNSVNPDGTVNKPSIEIRFTTAHSHEILRKTFNKDGIQTSTTVYSVINNKRSHMSQYGNSNELKGSTEFGQSFPGVNHLINVQVSKDPVGKILSYNADYTENGVVIAHIRANDAGDDTVWGTADDLITSFWDHNHKHINHDITRNYRANTESRMAIWQGFNSPDFDLKLIILTEHSGPKFQHRYVLYSTLGPNGDVDINPHTEDLQIIDDEISLWYKSEYSDGLRIRSWGMKGTGAGEGADNTLFTEDDIATALVTYEYYPTGHRLAGNLKQQVSYWKSGFEAPQSAWLTNPTTNLVSSEIPVRSYSVYHYDENGNKSEVTSYFTGDDEIANTADDFVTEINIFSIEPTISGQL